MAIFGGSEKCFGAVDIRKKELIKGTFKTAFFFDLLSSSLQSVEVKDTFIGGGI